MENPWKIISKTTAYDNNWINVEHYHVLTPMGKEGIYGQVNFKNLAIGIIPLTHENETFLVGQYRFPLREYSWEIPEGGCPLGQDPLKAAQRELLEETGIIAQEWTLISKVHTSNSVCNEIGYVYMAEELSYHQARPEETEVLSLRKLPIKEAVQMVMDNEITDSISVAGLLKLARIKGL